MTLLKALVLTSLLYPFAIASAQSPGVDISGGSRHSIAPNLPMPTPRDPRALDVINTALAALGGATPISQISTLIADGRDSDDPASTFSWQISRTDYKVVHRSPAGEFETNSGKGQAFRSANGTTSRVPSHVAFSHFHGVDMAPLLYRIANQSSYSAVYLGQQTIGNDAVSVVKTINKSSLEAARGSEVTWYFSSSTGLPMGAQCVQFLEGNSSLSRPISYSFSNYMNVSGYFFPSQLGISLDSTSSKRLTITSIQVNPEIPPTTFESRPVQR